MNQEEFRARTKALGLRVIRLVRVLPNDRESDVIARQLLKSGTSIGANYRAACRARSNADMIAKLKISEEEADETAYWLEILTDSSRMSQHQLASITKETNGVTAMIVALIKTLRLNNRKPRTNGSSKSSIVNRQS